jgi:hypothetical protein
MVHVHTMSYCYSYNPTYRVYQLYDIIKNFCKSAFPRCNWHDGCDAL